MKFVKPCLPDSRHISLRTPASSAKPCPPDSRHTSCGHRQILQSPVPRIPGTYPCGHRQALQSPVPGFQAHILADTGKLCKALSPGHGKAGRHDYGYSLQKKNGGKTAVPDTLCFFNNLWRFQARGQFPFL